MLREVVGKPKQRRKDHLYTSRYPLQGVALVAKTKKEDFGGCPWGELFRTREKRTEIRSLILMNTLEKRGTLVEEEGCEKIRRFSLCKAKCNL